MAVRASKQALIETAALLGTDRAQARRYLRRVQARAGAAISYTTILAAMREADEYDVPSVARRATALSDRDSN
jgi:hypothetical protein